MAGNNLRCRRHNHVYIIAGKQKEQHRRGSGDPTRKNRVSPICTFSPNYFLYSFYVGEVIISDLMYGVADDISVSHIPRYIPVEAVFGTREEVYSLPHAMMAHSDIGMNYFFVS